MVIDALIDFVTSHVTLLLVIIVVLLAMWRNTRRPSHLPPGPPLKFLLGNLTYSERDPRATFRKVRKDYGDIACLYLFHRPMIILNGYDVIKDALVKNADAFSDRPHSIFSDIFSEGKGLMTTSGENWQEQRRFSLNALREFGFGRTILEDKIHEEITAFLETIEAEGERPQDLQNLLLNTISNVICNIAFGKRFEYSDAKFKRYLTAMRENIEGLQASGIIALLPFLRFLPGDKFNFKRTLKNIRLIENELIMANIKEHLAAHDDGDVNDFISAYIKEMRHRQKQGHTTMDLKNLEKIIGELFTAGSESTATAIRWAVAYLLNYPDVQERCFQEVKEHVGLNRRPSMKDKLNLPYLEATIMEVLRISDIAPMGVPHSVAYDVRFRGYTIPKGTSVMVAISSVLLDPAVWGDPENFRPDRFLDESGKVVKPEEFIPFSCGRRICLGESMARMELFLFLASILQRFQLVNPDGEKPSLVGVLGLTHYPKPFKVIAKHRH